MPAPKPAMVQGGDTSDSDKEKEKETEVDDTIKSQDLFQSPSQQGLQVDIVSKSFIYSLID